MYLHQPLLVPNARVRLCPDTVGAWGQSREIYQAWDLPGAVVPARKYRLPAMEGKVAVVFQDEANAETVDLLLGPLSVKPDRPFVLRYCSSIKSFCGSDCFGSPKDKSCLAHIKQRTKRGGLNGHEYEWMGGDAKRKRPNPEEFTGARWIQSCQTSTGATVYVQAYKDESDKSGMRQMQMPYKWIATPQPDARVPLGIGYPGSHFPTSSTPEVRATPKCLAPPQAPRTRPPQLGLGAVRRADLNPFGTPAQVRQIPSASAAISPNVLLNSARMQGTNLLTADSAAALPPQWPMLPRPQLSLLPQPHHQLLLQPQQHLLSMPPQLSYLPGPSQLSLLPMTHAMPLGSVTPTMPLLPMHRAYPGLAVW